MPFIAALRSRIRGGTVDEELQAETSIDLDRLVRDLLTSALSRWQKNNYFAFDQTEPNLNVQVFGYCREELRTNPRFRILSVTFDHPDVTDEIFMGLRDAKTTRRPDLRVEVGRLGQLGRAIECKRLLTNGHWAKAYVEKGLARFVTGSYAHRENTGYMIGYSQDGDPTEHLARINDQVRTHAAMGATHELSVVGGDGDHRIDARSVHPRTQGSVEVMHFLVSISPD